MPDENNQPLPPIEKEAFDGYREEAAIHRDQPLLKKCNHQAVQIIDSQTLRCGCGAGWTGNDILTLYKALKEQ